MAVSAAIAALLDGASGLVALCGGRMYPDALPRNYTLPALTFTVNNTTITETKTSTTGWDEHDVTVQIHGISRTTVDAIETQVRSALNRKSGSYGSMTVITTNHRGSRWDFLEDETKPGSSLGIGVFICSMDFRIVTK